MAKINRYGGNLEAFASEAIGQERTVFGTETFDDSLTAQINALFRRGWGIVAPADAPKLQDFNALGYTTTQVLAYLHQMGIAEWNAAQEYYEGSVVTTLAGIYRLKSGGVGSSDPDTDGGVNWELIPTQAKVDAKADQATTYTETEVDGLLDAKADQATTYTETEVDGLLDAKANQATTYTETEVDGLLNTKADQSTTYTKTEAAVDFGSTTDDVDTVVKSGFYRVEGNANLPSGGGYGQLIVARGRDTILQLTSNHSGRLWQRSGNPSNTGGTGSYSEWEEISGKAPVDAPVFTGVPEADTAALGTSTKQIATTEFVSQALAGIPVTGTATFTNSTNNIALTGIGSIGLEIGDVVQVTGTASNNKLFTVEVITDSGNVIVNQAHAGGSTTKSLVDETVSATVTLVAKWFNAPLGLGQGWVDVFSIRPEGVTYTNNTGRSFQIQTLGSSGSSGQKFLIDGFVASQLGRDNDEQPISPIIRPGGTYLPQSGWLTSAFNIFLELR